MGFDWLNLEGGNIRFSGLTRGVDEYGHETFEIQLPSKPGMYGEFVPKFAENDNDFEIEVVSFGFFSRLNIANPHPDAREHFSAAEISAIEGLIIDLFASSEARNGTSIFMSKKGHFLERVHFASDWVLSDRP